MVKSNKMKLSFTNLDDNNNNDDKSKIKFKMSIIRSIFCEV